MGFLKAPSPPDPRETAEAQYEYNTKAARDQASLNALDLFSPYGTTTFQRNADGTPTSQRIELSPEVKRVVDAELGAGAQLGEAAQRQLSYLPQEQFRLPDDISAQGIAQDAFGDKVFDTASFADPMATPFDIPDRGNIAQTSYDQSVSLFAPDVEEMRTAKEIELANRGIPVGSEVWSREMDRMDRQEGNLYSQAARQAELDAGAEQSRQFSNELGRRQFLGGQQTQDYNRLAQATGYGANEYQRQLSNRLLERTQPYSEASALLGTVPNFQQPQFANTTASQIAAPDYAGQVNNNYNAKSQQHQGLMNTIGGLGSAAMKAGIFSDERLKENRVPLDGEEVLGKLSNMPVDQYDYKPEAQESLGVPESRAGFMAQDYSEAFGGDGQTIDLGDAVGRLAAAVKALDARTRGSAHVNN